jgi:adenosine deaminase
MGLFGLINKVTAPIATIRRVLREAVRDNVAEGVRYCELRIGLKRTPDKRTFLSALVEEVQLCRKEWPGTEVYILVSIARHGDAAWNRESLEVAIEFFQDADKGQGVVAGVDLGGNPNAGDFAKDFAPLLTEARDVGMGVSIHFAENAGCGDEHEAILAWAVRLKAGEGGSEGADSEGGLAQPCMHRGTRLGHAVFMSQEARSALLHGDRYKGLPVEVCIDCHKTFYGVANPDNIFGCLLRSGRPGPICLAVDNKGLGTSVLSAVAGAVASEAEKALEGVRRPSRRGLSEEYVTACKTFALTAAELAPLALGAFSSTFCDAEVKDRILCAARKEMEALLPEGFQYM